MVWPASKKKTMISTNVGHCGFEKHCNTIEQYKLQFVFRLPRFTYYTIDISRKKKSIQQWW